MATAACSSAQRVRPLSASPAVVNSVFRADIRPWMSLDGERDFAIDPSDSGEQKRWFTGTGPFSRKIYVPGTWEAQGIGDPGPSQPGASERSNILLTHSYRGTGWHRKTFHLGPAWQQKRVWLKIGGVNSQGSFWLNGQMVGAINSYCGTYKFDVTPLLKDGENILVAKVNQSGDQPQRPGELDGAVRRSVPQHRTRSHIGCLHR